MWGRSRKPKSVAIVGDGPAGATLGLLLAQKGFRVAIFGDGKRLPLVIGESLVPAITPILRELGVEEEVRSYSVLKPGATFVLHSRHGRARLRFPFAAVPSSLPGYTYNTPRDRFDATLRRAAVRAGARLIERRARLHVVGTDRVHLDADSIAATNGLLDGQPDYLVDATGRARTLARRLELPTRVGDRRDVSLFCHHSNVPIDDAGHVHNDLLDHGWAWRIPLRGRVSVGVVVDGDVLRRYGATPEEQFDRFADADPWLREMTKDSERLTPVMRYANYQLTTLRGVGPRPPAPGAPRWALVGDAFGFVDPVFASGLFLALWGAKRLCSAIEAGSDRALDRYERATVAHIDAWRRVVDYFYDGRLVTLFRVKEQVQDSRLGRWLNPHVGKHVARVLTGEAPTRRYSLALVDFMVKYGLMDKDPAEARIR